MPGNTDRLFQREAHGIIGNRVHVSQHFRGQASVILKAGCDIIDVVFSLDDGLAGVAGFELSQHRQVLPDFVRETEKNPATLLRGGRGPGTVVKGGFRRRHGTAYVVGIRIRNLSDYFFAGRVVNGESLGRLAVDPLAVDIHLISADFSFHSAWHGIPPAISFT